VWDEVLAGKYSHTLLSPEQALNPRFKSILRSPDFHQEFGLFAIDELHMVVEWKDFRPDRYICTLFPHLYPPLHIRLFRILHLQRGASVDRQ
jgi:superfamily II DNA helicase RecQ